MKLDKVSSIIATYAEAFEISGDMLTAKQLDDLAKELKKKGKLELKVLLQMLGRSSRR